MTPRHDGSTRILAAQLDWRERIILPLPAEQRRICEREKLEDETAWLPVTPKMCPLILQDNCNMPELMHSLL